MANDERPWFQARGRMSIREACIEVIRRVEPKNGISYDQAVDDIRELTGLDDIYKDSIMSPMNEASKQLRAIGEPGFENRRTRGWVRETPDQMVEAGERHERKERRQGRWAVEAADNAPVEQLDWDHRDRRTGLLDRHRKRSELEERRTHKRRPLPPAEAS